MHVIHVRDAEHPSEQHAKEAGLFVSMQQVVPLSEHQAKGSKQQEDIQEELDLGRPDRHVTDKPQDRGAKNRHSRDYEILPYMVGHQIHVMAKLRQRPQSSEHAERRTAGLKKRFRCDHQYVHGLFRRRVPRTLPTFVRLWWSKKGVRLKPGTGSEVRAKLRPLSPISLLP